MFVVCAYDKKGHYVLEGFPFLYVGKNYFRSKHFKSLKSDNKRYNDASGTMIHSWMVFDTNGLEPNSSARCIKVIPNN